jgi:hypothetical protein
MTFFPDLAHCTYFGPGNASRLKAVGWLEHDRPFRRDAVSPRFIEKLASLLERRFEVLAPGVVTESPWQPFIFSGPHFCSICKARSGQERHGEVYNVFIPGDGFLYVAPVLIRHYLEAHGYAPPWEFIQAVMACPRMSSPDYLAAVAKNGPRFHEEESLDAAEEVSAPPGPYPRPSTPRPARRGAWRGPR